MGFKNMIKNMIKNIIHCVPQMKIRDQDDQA